ncbi:hypothetical protein HDU92_006394, partial [Lobulomyces angularis]
MMEIRLSAEKLGLDIKEKGIKSESNRKATIDLWYPKQLINYDGERIRYFKQLAIYMSETFETNIKVNVQGNFIKKINTLITRIVVKQNYPPQIPRNLPRCGTSTLKIERDLHINNLRERANIVRSAIFDSLSLPENLHLDDQVLTAHILAILPQQIIANGIPRDITT